MPRAQYRLPDTVLSETKCPKKFREPGMHPDGGGLYLRVTPGGTRSWMFRYARAVNIRSTGAAAEEPVPVSPRQKQRSREHHMGLGSVHDVSLAEAREQARLARLQLRDRIDPLVERRERRRAVELAAAKEATFEWCAAEYIKAHRNSWRNPVHAKQWESTLATHAHPVLGKLPVHQIDIHSMMRVLEPIWYTMPETANRVRNRIELVLDWAAVREHRNSDNPARWRGRLNKLLPNPSKVRKVRNHPALPWRQIPSFMSRLRSTESVATPALELLIRTATRSDEVRKARWPEFDLEEKTWTIPGKRTKSGEEFRVPLSRPAVALLRAVKEAREDTASNDERAFADHKGRPLSYNAVLDLVKRVSEGGYTVHGMRSSFRDWAAERRPPVRADIAEAALAHVVGNATRRAYQRGDLFDLRRDLMEAWSRFCDGGPADDDALPTISATPTV
jgi:integrase